MTAGGAGKKPSSAGGGTGNSGNSGKTGKDAGQKSGKTEKVSGGTTGIRGVNVSGEKGIVSAEAVPGDTVTLGSYAASADGKKSPVEWTVLENRNGYALLISKEAVDCLPYHDSWADMTWEKCSLRSWLNIDFLEKAFSPEERKSIVSSTVVNRDNSGNPGGAVTNDQVFILDIDELEQYFDSDEDRRAGATDYAQSQGAFVDEKRDACWYWVRNPGDSPRYAVYVNCLGDIL